MTFTLPDGSTVAVDGFFDKDHLGDRSMGALPTSSFLARCYCGQVCTCAMHFVQQSNMRFSWDGLNHEHSVPQCIGVGRVRGLS